MEASSRQAAFPVPEMEGFTKTDSMNSHTSSKKMPYSSGLPGRWRDMSTVTVAAASLAAAPPPPPPSPSRCMVPMLPWLASPGCIAAAA